MVAFYLLLSCDPAQRGWMAAGLLREGKLEDRVEVLEGFEQASAALARLFTGENRGKQLVRIGDPPLGQG